MSLNRITVALLGTAFIVLCGCGDDTSDRFFSLPSDPPGTFIEATFPPPESLQSWRSKSLTILGDGSAALRVEMYKGRVGIYEFRLSGEELGELFSLVLESNLMEHDPARANKADFHKIGSYSYSKRGPVVSLGYVRRRAGPALTVHLLETNCPGRAPGSPVAARARVPALRADHQRLERVVESLVELGDKLTDIQMRASSEESNFLQFSERP